MNNIAKKYKCYLNGNEIPEEVKLIIYEEDNYKSKFFKTINVILSYNKTLGDILKTDNILTICSIGRDPDTPTYKKCRGAGIYVSYILDTQAAKLVLETGKFECRFVGLVEDTYFTDNLPTVEEILEKRKEKYLKSISWEELDRIAKDSKTLEETMRCFKIVFEKHKLEEREYYGF